MIRHRLIGVNLICGIFIPPAGQTRKRDRFSISHDARSVVHFFSSDKRRHSKIIKRRLLILSNDRKKLCSVREQRKNKNFTP